MCIHHSNYIIRSLSVHALDNLESRILDTLYISFYLQILVDEALVDAGFAFSIRRSAGASITTKLLFLLLQDQFDGGVGGGWWSGGCCSGGGVGGGGGDWIGIG